MNLVLVVPWSMAATYTSSPSLAMIPPASAHSDAVRDGWEQRVGREEKRRRQTNRWQLRAGPPARVRWRVYRPPQTDPIANWENLCRVKNFGGGLSRGFLENLEKISEIC
jgi:hypothetical protein